MRTFKDVVEKAGRYIWNNANEGGWGYTEANLQTFLEPTTWCILALSLLNDYNIEEFVTHLVGYQNEDGGWSNYPGTASDIRTANVLLALLNIDSSIQLYAQPIAKGLHWLEAKRLQSDRGWAWVNNAWDFTEPTCLATMAFRSTQAPLHFLGQDRQVSPINFQLNRHYGTSVKEYIFSHQCIDGGWNSHAPYYFGIPQKSSPSVTSWALITLDGLISNKKDIRIENALVALRRWAEYRRIESPYSLAVCLIAMLMYEDDASMINRIAGTLATLQDNDGGWKGNLLWTSLATIALINYLQNM